jgi:hypothetical protein
LCKTKNEFLVVGMKGLPHIVGKQLVMLDFFTNFIGRMESIGSFLARNSLSLHIEM